MSIKHRILFLVLLNTSLVLAESPVRITDMKDQVILSNEFVKVSILKKSATISSINYRGLEMIGKPHKNWNVVGSDDETRVERFPRKLVYTIRQDPSKNDGERAEVSFKYIYEGDTSTMPLDIDLRFTLGKQDRGIYLSALWSHRKGFPAFQIGQGRILIVLNPKIFDFYTVDSKRRGIMATGQDVKNGLRRNVKEANLLTSGINKGKVEHKYDYSAILAQTPTWGWTSTHNRVGFWMINPSFEYINGGPTQVGNTGHVETILMNHWQDGHYGGEALQIEDNEAWEKFIGPFFMYCNAGSNNDAMWMDAIKESENQRKNWPFNWVNAKEYLTKQERGILSGQIKVSDSYGAKFSNMWVGLANPSNNINWQNEHKYYQFWVRADSLGNFSIPNIRPGQYNLYAFADGILGEYKKTDITITTGENTNLGQLIYTPLRYGKPLWEIGIPDRSAAEFRHGDHYWQWGLYMLYPKEFPEDVNFTIGKSNWSTDWNYCQPVVIGPDYQVIRGTKWQINFDMPKKATGKATLRLAICGSRDGEVIYVALNGKPIGNTGHLPSMGVMHRDGIRGKQFEIAIPFDAALLQEGKNTIQLSFNAKKWVFGVLYDYLRLELEER